MSTEVRKSSGSAAVAVLVAIVLVVVDAVLVLAGVKLYQNNGSMTPAEAANSCVWILEGYSDFLGISHAFCGTGWAIGTPGEDVQYIVTNGHVVENYYEGYGSDNYLRVYFSQSESENNFVVPEVVYYSPSDEKDIAILKLPEATDKRVPLSIRDSDTVKVGETATALGYPGVAMYTDNASFDVRDVTVTKGSISKLGAKPTGHGYEAFQTDAYINHGNSGGPLVDDDGFAIGINASIVENTSIGYSIISNELTAILDSENIPYTTADDAKNAKNGGMLLIALGVLLLIIEAAVGFHVMNTKKSNASSSEKDSEKEQQTPVREPAPAAVAVEEKREKPAKRAVLRGLSGAYAGQEITIESGKIIFGRDTSVCNVVYPEGTPGISSRHCQLVYDAKDDSFFLTDLGSTYGTFFKGDKKLQPNVPERLFSGDKFYLSDSNNSFVVMKV